MKKLNNLIIVAGSGRNVGKTEFVCRLIEKFSSKVDIYGLKVSAVHPDEGIYHGGHGTSLLKKHLVEETRLDHDKDTSRMLRAGARRVFYLQGDDARINSGFEQFRSRIPADGVIVCESGSLWKIVHSGLLILITGNDTTIKPRSVELSGHASLTVQSDGKSGFPGIEKIGLSESCGWFLVFK